MHDYQREFLQFAITQDVLRFGEFTLKSGRQSPYFFNTGLFNTGEALAKLGYYYAQAIQHANLDFDMLFGPAYKGIPLVATTAIALATHYQRDLPFCFNRKEVKDHGEGGLTVGAPLQGKVLLVDDVISAGTAIRESVQLIEKVQAQLAGIIIVLNRQERGQSQYSAITEIEQAYRIPVISIVTLEHICEFLEERGQQDKLQAIQQYKQQYGEVHSVG